MPYVTREGPRFPGHGDHAVRSAHRMTEIVRAHVKKILGQVLFATPWPRTYLRDKYVITAFHRVNDVTHGDGLTCATEQFRSICEWLRRNFRVVPLAEQIRETEAGRPAGGTASITFDDGYLDNFEVAAPILRELGLPATFFVTTAFIGSSTVANWDDVRGTKTEWMTWQHLRALAAQGFDIESHTCNHVDLGTADPSTVRRELDASLAKLASEVGKERRRLFAYPFGGIANISPAARAQVREAGYLCCLSCYGGINGVAADPYTLMRIPINEEYQSPAQLGLKILRAAVAR
jgi:peptidoglycan/xylan/chitin deacetylase (PgdA/CDA1 family)